MTKTSHCVLVALQPALYSPCISSNKIWMLKLLLQLVILCLMKKTYPCSCNRMLNVIRWSAVKISIIVDCGLRKCNLGFVGSSIQQMQDLGKMPWQMGQWVVVQSHLLITFSLRLVKQSFPVAHPPLRMVDFCNFLTSLYVLM